MKQPSASKHTRLLCFMLSLSATIVCIPAGADMISGPAAQSDTRTLVSSDIFPATPSVNEPSVSAKILQTQAVEDKTIVTINKGSNDGVQIGDRGEVADTKVSFRITKVFKFRSTAVVDIRHDALEGLDKANIKPTGNHETPAANG